MQEIYVDTLSAINIANGVVRLFFVRADLDAIATGNAATAEAKPSLSVAMPLAGFLYAASVSNQFMQDEAFSKLLERMQKAGLLQAAPAAIEA